MAEYIAQVARDGVFAVGSLFTGARSTIDGWLRGGDMTVIFALAAVALVLLFVVVPNRRRF